MVSSYDRKLSIRNYVNTALEHAQIDEAKEKKKKLEKPQGEASNVPRSMLPGKFLSKFKETREARNDEMFAKMKREQVQKDVINK